MNMFLRLACASAVACLLGVSASMAQKPSYLWIDAEANFARFNSPDSIDFYLDKAKAVGFTHVIVDVRPITGEVLYDSKIAPRLSEWNGKKAAKFDYLGRFIQRGHEKGLGVLASMNVFCAGHNYFDRGVVYSSNPEWASVVYSPDRGIVPITAEKHKYGAMANPSDEAYQDYIISIMKELAGKYPSLDGLVTDRVRYDGITADFSDESKKQFEQFIHSDSVKWPDDVFKWTKKPDGKPEMVRGKYFKQWIEWRATVIAKFMERARKAVKEVNPKLDFDTYTGAWYPSYYEVGVNFASPSYDPAKDFDWATPSYKSTGYIENIDTYFTGNYYTDVTISDYMKTNKLVKNETDLVARQGSWYCVEGSCRKLRGILGGHPFIGGVLADQFYSNPPKLSEAVAENLKESDGLMLFDIVHLIKKDLWKYVADGIKKGNEP